MNKFNAIAWAKPVVCSRAKCRAQQDLLQLQGCHVGAPLLDCAAAGGSAMPAHAPHMYLQMRTVISTANA